MNARDVILEMAHSIQLPNANIGLAAVYMFGRWPCPARRHTRVTVQQSKFTVLNSSFCHLELIQLSEENGDLFRATDR